MAPSPTTPDQPAARFWPEADQILARALELAPAERPAYVAAACAGRPELAAEVDSLLRAGAAAGDFLECPTRIAPDPDGSLPLPPLERVGPYRLIEEVGHGGMSVVFRAERDDGQFHSGRPSSCWRPAGSVPRRCGDSWRSVKSWLPWIIPTSAGCRMAVSPMLCPIW